MIDLHQIKEELIGQSVERPNRATEGTLSGHAAGEPFEKLVYHSLKAKFPDRIFKQYEYLNDLYLKHPTHISYADRNALFDSPTVLFLLSRGEKATREWNPQHIFEEKQNDTADIIFHDQGYFDLIDVKTRNLGKKAQAPNIISAVKLAKTCANMLDNREFSSFDIHYIEIDWQQNGSDRLVCNNVHIADLFKCNPQTLYINWAAAMQIQFHVCDLSQDWQKDREQWAKAYLHMFVHSAQRRCRIMYEEYVQPFLKYIEETDAFELTF